jgi:hypothetical protein
MIITQKPTQSFAALNGAVAADVGTPWEQQDITLPLVIPLGMVMLDVVAQGPPQRALAEKNQLGQAFLLHRPDPALRIGIQVRAAYRQHQRLDPTGRDDRLERMGVLGVAIIQQASQQSVSLFDHLVGDDKQRPRNVEAQVAPWSFVNGFLDDVELCRFGQSGTILLVRIKVADLKIVDFLLDLTNHVT